MPEGLKEIEALIALMAKLPGLGPRSARRTVLHLIKKRDTQMRPLAQVLTHVADTARSCMNCGNIGLRDVCDICKDDRRMNGQICVVEDVADLWAMERTDVFRGRYHVLGGTLSPLDEVGPEQLRLPLLESRLTQENVKELILALNATLEGQTTAHYIEQTFEDKHDLTISTLAQGVPMGGELDFLDDGTIATALSARKIL